MNKKTWIIVNVVCAVLSFIIFSFWEFIGWLIWNSTTYNMPFWVHGLIGVAIAEIVWITIFVVNDKNRK